MITVAAGARGRLRVRGQDAVVIADPVRYQRRRDERDDVSMPLRSLHFGPDGQRTDQPVTGMRRRPGSPCVRPRPAARAGTRVIA